MSWAAFCVTHCCDCIFTILLQRRQSGLKSGDRGSGSTKISILPGKFSKHFDYFQSNFRNISIFSGKFSKQFDFFRQFHKKIQFFRQSKKIPIFHAKIAHLQTATSGQIILFLFKSHHFRSYFLYTTRYNNISRPVHDALRPPAQNLGVATPNPLFYCNYDGNN